MLRLRTVNYTNLHQMSTIQFESNLERRMFVSRFRVLLFSASMCRKLQIIREELTHRKAACGTPYYGKGADFQFVFR